MMLHAVLWLLGMPVHLFCWSVQPCFKGWRYWEKQQLSKKPQPLLYRMSVFQPDEIGGNYTVKPDGTDGWNICSFF